MIVFRGSKGNTLECEEGTGPAGAQPGERRVSGWTVRWKRWSWRMRGGSGLALIPPFLLRSAVNTELPEGDVQVLPQTRPAPRPQAG